MRVEGRKGEKGEGGKEGREGREESGEGGKSEGGRVIQCQLVQSTTQERR